MVLLAAKRTKQLLSGAKPLLSNLKNKPVVTALREVATGDVRFMTDEDMQKMKEREKKLREARLLEQSAGDDEERIKAQALLSADDLFISSPKVSKGENGAGEDAGDRDVDEDDGDDDDDDIEDDGKGGGETEE